MAEPRYIPNAQLQAAKLPAPRSEWDAIGPFALTFNGYKYWGSVERCAELANARRDGGGGEETLSELRSCLFFEQRKYHHCGYGPSPDELRYVHSLLEEIRTRVKAANELLA